MENSIYFTTSKPDLAVKIGELLTGRDFYLPGGEAYCCAFSPDESRFAWSCGFRKVILVPWNREKNCLVSQDNKDTDGNIVYSERIHIDCGFPVCSLAFGAGVPEGELAAVKRNYWTRFDYSRIDLIFATGHNNGRIRIWDPYTGQILLELTDHKYGSWVHCLAFAPDGSLRLASGSEDGTVKTWDLSDDGNMYKTLVDDQGRYPVRDLAWSPNSKLLCCVGVKQKALIWEMEECKLSKRLVGHFNDVVSCCFSPDGCLVATSSHDTRVIIWNTETGEQLKIMNHRNPPPGVIYMAGDNDYYVKCVSFLPNGYQLSTTCIDGYLRIWNLFDNSSEPEGVAKGNPEGIMLKCCSTPRGSTIAVSYASGCAEFFKILPEVPSLVHLARMCARKQISMGDIRARMPPMLANYLGYKHF